MGRRLIEPKEWGIHELRLYSGGSALEAGRDFRLRSFPNPWELPSAVDGEQATRWRSWEALSRGMWIEAEFFADRDIDRITVELSGESSGCRMHVETQNPGEGWRLVEAKIAESAENIEGFHRLASAQLRAAGFQYLFVTDADYGAKDIATWGLPRVAADQGATLYRIGP